MNECSIFVNAPVKKGGQKYKKVFNIKVVLMKDGIPSLLKMRAKNNLALKQDKQINGETKILL